MGAAAEKSQVPTTEQGAPSMVMGSPGGLLPWTAFIDDREYAPDVKWPSSIGVFQRMQTDAQIKGMLLALTLPIRRFRWELDPNGADAPVVDHIAQSLNLPIAGQEDQEINQRRRKRFSHDKHLGHALRALAYGHFYFEETYDYQDPRDGGDGLFHLAKLGTRPPRTIARIEVDDAGELDAIYQNVGRRDGSGFVMGGAVGLTGVRLEASRLVPYIWDSEDDGDWIGRSMLRACYRNWIAKDRLIRMDLVKHERNSMGIPWFEVDAAASDPQIERMAEIARRMRAGEESGGAGPGKLTLQGVQGTLPDTVASIREHDHQMSRAFLSMIFELGTAKTGSYSLGEVFHELMLGTQDTVAEWYRDRTQADVVEREVEINWGPEAQPPLLVGRRVESEQLSFSDFVSAVDKGLIAVDEEVAAYLKTRYGIPAKKIDKPNPTPPPPPPPAPPAARARRQTVASAAAEVSLPDRALRRQPYEQEVQAKTDYAAIEATWLDERTKLVSAVRTAQGEQIDALVSAVEAHAGDATALAELRVDPIDDGVIRDALLAAVEEGIASAKAERAAQLGEAATAAESAAGKPVRAAAQEANKDAADSRMDDRAVGLALLLAGAIGAAASKKAQTVSSVAAADAGAAVRSHLEGLSDAFLEEQLGGALWEGTQTGRREFMRANSPEKVYSSELLDGNTCDPCVGVDGTEWPTVDAAEGDGYSQGGFEECEGGLRCRGMLVATYGAS